MALPLVAALLLAGCATEPHAPGGPYYYRSYVMYQEPFHPADEIPESQARALRDYCVVWYNADGRILRAQRFAGGERVLDERYTYSNGEIVERSWIDADGIEHTEPWGKKKPWP